MLLELDGHTTMTASNGEAGLALVAEFEPETVILDIGLPGMNGYEVATRIRDQGTRSVITLIALTGWAQQQDKESALSAGFDFYLTKPVDYEQLAGILSRSGSI